MLENLPYFQKHLESDLGRVNVVINQAVQSEVALISQIGTYIISAGGKSRWANIFVGLFVAAAVYLLFTRRK